MNSSMIGKIEKAHRYAREPERVQLGEIEATFHGGHDDYKVTLHHGEWTCNCHTFTSHSVGTTCSHIMALQEILSPMLNGEARIGSAAAV